MLLLQRLADLNDRIKRATPGYMLVLAIVIGLLAGYGAVAVRFLIQWLRGELWATDAYGTAWIASLPWYWIVGVPTAGGLVVGMITTFFSREARGHGVPEVMEAIARRDGRIRPRVVLAKIAASGVCIASGGSVGREGPMVQIGSAIGSTVGQWLRVGPRRMRTLVGCGAAAGIAATFNAPVAGALFAVEIILGDFAVPQFSPIVIASVAATVVSHRYLGNQPAFEIPKYQLAHPSELLAYAVLGLLAGVVAWAFIRTLSFSEDRFDELKMHPILKAMAGGACVGTMALVLPGVLGVGYETMNEALMGHPTLLFLAVMLVAKLLAVCITLASGGSGGVFAPSLFLGAMLGACVGIGAETLLPVDVAPMGAYALVGMGAVVSAATHAPITAILIVFELTNDYRIMLPLMTACILATLLASRLERQSIYTIKLARRGVDIRAGQDINLLRNIPVSDVLRDEGIPTVSGSESLTAMIAGLARSDAPGFYVVDGDRRLQGVVTMRELRPVLQDAALLQHLVVASDLVDTAPPSVAAGDTLDTVLLKLDLGYRDELPVVDPDGNRLVGVVRIADVLARYRKELNLRQMAAQDESV